MLRSVESLKGYDIKAKDGEIGKATDLLFDDKLWTTRYLVVKLGSWFNRHKQLIAAAELGQPDWKNHRFPVDLTRDQIKNSPDLDDEMPLSRQREIELHNYFQWVPYWTTYRYPETETVGAPPGPPPGAPPTGLSPTLEHEFTDKMKDKGEDSFDYHLRSMKEVEGYQIQAKDDDVGHVEEFIVDDEDWTIRYLVIDTRNWLPGGKKVLIAPEWIETVSWAERHVHVGLEKDQIKDSPEYDPNKAVNREYEEVLYDFYGKPKYWLQSLMGEKLMTK